MADVYQLGRQAQTILESDAFKLAAERLDKGLVEAWANGTFPTSEQREEVFNRVRGFRMMRAELERMLGDLAVAQDKDRRAEKKAKATKKTGDS